MSQRAYLITTCIFFLIVAFLHLLRLVFGWEILMEGWPIPRWLNFVALIITGYLAYAGFKLSRK
jgi:hypothetical protein